MWTTAPQAFLRPPGRDHLPALPAIGRAQVGPAEAQERPRTPPAEPALPPLPALEGEQIAALAELERFLASDRQCFLMQGLAGTGKTTVLAHLARRLGGRVLGSPRQPARPRR